MPGTSASDFEVKEIGKKKKGDDKNINWNIQVLAKLIKEQQFTAILFPEFTLPLSSSRNGQQGPLG